MNARSSTPSEEDKAALEGSLYRVVWRWHFIAGVLLGPLIVVIAATGGLYAFKRELEPLWHGDVLLATPRTSVASVDDVVALALAETAGGWSVDQVEIEADPARSWAVAMHGPRGGNRRIFVDQYRGAVLGEISDESLFPLTLELHRSLFIGSTGRIVVELATCWTIILLGTGMYLWWPRPSKKNRALWRPTWRGPKYRIVRDFHAVAGFWALPVAAMMAITGLVYSYAWGKGFQFASLATGSYDIYLQPTMINRPSGAAPSWERVREATLVETKGQNVSILPPGAEGAAYLVISGGTIGPSLTHVLAVDGGSGEIVLRKRLGEMTPLAQWSSWNYPLHTGSVLGLPTKLVWGAASLTLALLPVTGVWMWLLRRPTGKIGWPRTAAMNVPLWLKCMIVAVCCALPVAGLSILLAWLGDWSWSVAGGKLRRRQH